MFIQATPSLSNSKGLLKCPFAKISKLVYSSYLRWLMGKKECRDNPQFLNNPDNRDNPQFLKKAAQKHNKPANENEDANLRKSIKTCNNHANQMLGLHQTHIVDLRTGPKEGAKASHEHNPESKSIIGE